MATAAQEGAREKSHFVKGPLGFGDPDDKRLRKTERDIIIPKMLRDEAAKKCSETLKTFVECSKKAGILVIFKCSAENDANNKCMTDWYTNPQLVQEVTDKYLEARSHYRRTGYPVEKYLRKKKTEGAGFC